MFRRRLFSAEEDEQRGHLAQQVIDNPLFIEALSDLRDWSIRAFANATTPEMAWAARLKLESAEQVAKYLRTHVAKGKMQAAKEVA